MILITFFFNERCPTDFEGVRRSNLNNLNKVMISSKRSTDSGNFAKEQGLEGGLL